jgi:hypothetical protein
MLWTEQLPSVLIRMTIYVFFIPWSDFSLDVFLCILIVLASWWSCCILASSLFTYTFTCLSVIQLSLLSREKRLSVILYFQLVVQSLIL